tara:strand:+ start:395 stop:586 length:192 start_codon:yes stop_codon:yes gene_type:complete
MYIEKIINGKLKYLYEILYSVTADGDIILAIIKLSVEYKTTQQICMMKKLRPGLIILVAIFFE